MGESQIIEIVLHVQSHAAIADDGVFRYLSHDQVLTVIKFKQSLPLGSMHWGDGITCLLESKVSLVFMCNTDHILHNN